MLPTIGAACSYSVQQQAQERRVVGVRLGPVQAGASWVGVTLSRSGAATQCRAITCATPCDSSLFSELA